VGVLFLPWVSAFCLPITLRPLPGLSFGGITSLFADQLPSPKGKIPFGLSTVFPQLFVFLMIMLLMGCLLLRFNVHKRSQNLITC